MIQLSKTAGAWGNTDFNDVLKTEIEQLDAARLPLQQGLSQSSYVSEDKFRLMIINVTESGGCIRARTGIFYAGIVAGCNCADDPTPADSLPEYCELQFDINRETGETTVTLLDS